MILCATSHLEPLIQSAMTEPSASGLSPVHYAAVAAIGAFLVYRFVSQKSKKQDPKPVAHSKFLDATTYKEFALQERIIVTHNVRIFRFALPYSDQPLGLPIGKHLSLRAQTKFNPKVAYRSYTPITDDDSKGYFDLLVKVYDQGTMSRHLDQLSVGETVEMRGPKGKFEYEEGKYSKIGMLCGGTGITPMFQVIQHIMKNKADKTQVSLVYANVTEEDILLRKELETFAAEDSRFNVYFTLDKPNDDWQQGKGFITTETIKEHLPSASENCLVLLCGPPPMMKFMEKNLDSLDYSAEQRFFF